MAGSSLRPCCSGVNARSTPRCGPSAQAKDESGAAASLHRRCPAAQTRAGRSNAEPTRAPARRLRRMAPHAGRRARGIERVDRGTRRSAQAPERGALDRAGASAICRRSGGTGVRLREQANVGVGHRRRQRSRIRCACVALRRSAGRAAALYSATAGAARERIIKDFLVSHLPELISVVWNGPGHASLRNRRLTTVADLEILTLLRLDLLSVILPPAGGD